MGEEIESATGPENRSFSMEGNPMRNRGNLVQLKLQEAHQDIGDANEPLAQNLFCNSTNKLFISSENTLLDCGDNGEERMYCHRKKESSLVHEANHKGDTGVGEEEDVVFNESDEHVKEEKVPQMTKNGYNCSVCGKDFKSMKSLCGHMRCHPERGWRGIQPPCAAKMSASSTMSDSGGKKMDDHNDSTTTMESLASDQLPPLSNWSTKRNHKIAAIGALEVANHHLEGMQDEELEAIGNLLMLANGDVKDWGQVKKQQAGEESNGKIMEFEWENSQVQEQDYASGDENGSEAMEEDYRAGIKQRPEKMHVNRRGIPKKRKFQHMNSVYGKHEFLASARHICRTCNRSFPSHQALGGHRASSHKKGNLMSVSEVDDGIEDDRYASSDVAHTKSLPETQVLPSEAETVYRCKTCDKTFRSGQALGGHQRCHWLGAVDAPTIPNRLLEDERKPERRIHNFDLNELPMDEGSNDL